MRFQLVKTDSVISHEDFFSPNYRMKELHDLAEERRRQRRSHLCIGLGLVLIAAIVITTIILSHFYNSTRRNNFSKLEPCSDTCTVTVVESIPENLTYTKSSVQSSSTYNGWQNLLAAATESLDIAAFYFSLRGSDTKTIDPSTAQGENIFQGIVDAGKRGNLKYAYEYCLLLFLHFFTSVLNIMTILIAFNLHKVFVKYHLSMAMRSQAPSF